MPEFQREIDDAKGLAATRGFGRLTFGWKERDRGHSFDSISGSVTVTSTSPSVVRVYDRDHAMSWLERFDNDLSIGVFGVSRL